MKFNWTKCPSVIRTGKFFYHRPGATVRQSFLTGEWAFQRDGGLEIGGFATAREAMKSCDKSR